MLRKAILSVAVVGLTGCLNDGLEPSTIEQHNRIQVEQLAFDHTVAVSPSSLMPGEGGLARLDGFLRALGPRYGDRLEITGGSPRGRRLVSQHLQGLMLQTADYGGAGGRPLTVTLRRAVAIAPPCGDWSHYEEPADGRHVTSNHGCAQASNLARMVADPNDLLGGRPLGYGHAMPAASWIDAYRNGRRGGGDNGSGQQGGTAAGGAPATGGE